MKFYCSTINAHQSRTFGGKPDLWDFLSNAAQNLNWDDRWNHYNDNSRCFREIVDCIICTTSMSYNPINEVHCVDRNDAKQL